MYLGKIIYTVVPDHYTPGTFRGAATKENGDVIVTTKLAYTRERMALAEIKKIKIVRNNVK